MDTRADFLKDRFASLAAGVVVQLRDLADEVERRLASTPIAGSETPVTERAEDVVNAITWGVANLNLGRLVAKAGAADVEAMRALAGEGR